MLNSLSAVTWEDFLKLKFSKVSDERATVVTKCLGKFTTSGITIYGIIQNHMLKGFNIAIVKYSSFTCTVYGTNDISLWED
jgi:hypothetical protein